MSSGKNCISTVWSYRRQVREIDNMFIRIPTTLEQIYPQPSTNDTESRNRCGTELKETVDKRTRTTFTKYQLNQLECEYRKQNYVKGILLVQLAERLSLTEKIVKTWFQNRRMKDRRELRGLKKEATYNGTEEPDLDEILDYFKEYFHNTTQTSSNASIGCTCNSNPVILIIQRDLESTAQTYLENSSSHEDVGQENVDVTLLHSFAQLTPPDSINSSWGDSSDSEIVGSSDIH